MKLAIEFKDTQYESVNIDLRYGNDGIGGTEYSILKIAFMYSITHTDDEVIAFHYNSNFVFNNNIKSVILSDNYKEIIEERPDILLTNAYLRDEYWYELLEKNNVELVLLANNFPSAEKLMQFNRHECVKKIVFKTGQEADCYYDDDIIDKAEIIGNILYPSEIRRADEYKNIVTYMGALVPCKGFHLLAKQWKKIIKEVPNAELHVIGSGKLYDKDAKLGKYGVATEDYENVFMPYLLDDDKNILSSVFFHGIMGKEKYDILRETAVGVPNPSGKTETFCNVAVEMQDVGIPIVTIAKYSFFDVVSDKKSGFLYKNSYEFRKYIIRLLKDKQLNNKMGAYGHEYVKKYYYNKIIPKWEGLFEEVLMDKNDIHPKLHGHFIRNKKICIAINAFFRRKLKLEWIRPMNQRRKRLTIKNIKSIIKRILKNI